MTLLNPSTLTEADWRALTRALSQPFPTHLIQWRAGSTTKDKTKAQALPYIDPREYEKRLDDLCPGHWHLDFQPWGNHRIICHLTIHHISRSSTGEENAGKAPGTSAEAQAFKRACSKFGLGRYLYDLPIPWVKYDPITGRLLEQPHTHIHTQPHTQATTTHTQATTTHTPTTNPPTTTPTLDRARASAMHRELGKLGFKREEHYYLAVTVTKRDIQSLTSLTEEEAARVYNYAKRLNHAARNTHASRVTDQEAHTILN